MAGEDMEHRDLSFVAGRDVERWDLSFVAGVDVAHRDLSFVAGGHATRHGPAALEGSLADSCRNKHSITL